MSSMEKVSPAYVLIRVEFALPHDAFILFLWALDAVLKLAFARWERREHLVEAIGRVAVRIAAAEANLLTGMKPARNGRTLMWRHAAQ